MVLKPTNTAGTGAEAPTNRSVSPDVLASAQHTEESASFSSTCGVDDNNYLTELLHEKKELKSLDPQCNFRHAARLMDGEISRLLETITDPHPDETNGRSVLVSETVMVPVQQYPKYNFVGRLLGPRGMTARQLEEETGCRIMIRGRGSTRGRKASQREKEGKEVRECKEEKNAKAGDAPEPLHVVVECEDLPHVAEKKVKYAMQLLDKMLHPPPEGKDDLKRKQLIELSIINGTYRPTSATKYTMPIPRIPYFTGFGDNRVNSRGGTSNIPQGNDDRQMQPLMSFFNPTLQSAMLNNPLLAAEYYRSCSFADTSSGGVDLTAIHPTPAPIHPASPLAYAQAASMLHSLHDGSGDAPKLRRH